MLGEAQSTPRPARLKVPQNMVRRGSPVGGNEQVMVVGNDPDHPETRYLVLMKGVSKPISRLKTNVVLES